VTSVYTAEETHNFTKKQENVHKCKNARQLNCM